MCMTVNLPEVSAKINVCYTSQFKIIFIGVGSHRPPFLLHMLFVSDYFKNFNSGQIAIKRFNSINWSKNALITNSDIQERLICKKCALISCAQERGLTRGNCPSTYVKDLSTSDHLTSQSGGIRLVIFL